MVIGKPDAISRFEYNGNCPRERSRNSDLNFIAVTDPRLSGNLRTKLQSARKHELRSLRNNAQSRLPDQEFFETPATWNFRSDDDLPRVAESISGSIGPGRARWRVHGWISPLQPVL